MVRLVDNSTQQSRSKQRQAPKSCLTLVLSGSDNGSLSVCRRRKSFCGLQLDGIFGAMVLSLRANQTLAAAEWFFVTCPRIADQKILPVLAELSVQPEFLNQESRTSRSHFAQSVCCRSLSSSVFTCTDWNRNSNCRGLVVSREFSKLYPSGSPDRNCRPVKESVTSVA